MTQKNISIKQALGSPLDCKKVKPVSAKGSQSWIFIGRTDAKAETPILWPSAAKNWLFGKDPDAGKDRRHEEKGTSEDEMVVWHHQPIGHEFKQALRVGDEQGGLACCSSWGCRVRHEMIKQTHKWREWTCYQGYWWWWGKGGLRVGG